MTLSEIKDKLTTQEYNFLRTNENLGDSIILITLGGSYAYGTSTPGSDLDIRGCATNRKQDILTGGHGFEQFTNEKTDTVIYSFNKLVSLLTDCNPNTIEMLGNKPEFYLHVSPIGQELLDNFHMFLSQKAVHTFGGYAMQQLRRLENKANLNVGQEGNEQHILDTINHASITFKENFFEHAEDAIKLYIDKAAQEGYDTEIFMDVTLKHYPLRDYAAMWNEMTSIVRSYSKIGKRNEKAIEHNKLGKHMMHLIRLYMMCLDILEKEQIVTYRSNEHDLLMDIRNGKYLDTQMQPVPEFYEMLDGYEKRLQYAKKNTGLPEKPDYNAIQEFTATVNESIVKKNV